MNQWRPVGLGSTALGPSVVRELAGEQGSILAFVIVVIVLSIEVAHQFQSIEAGTSGWYYASCQIEARVALLKDEEKSRTFSCVCCR